MILFEQLHKFILSDVNIHVPQGTSLGLIGSSGSGKTTFLKLTCGLLQPTAGHVHTMGLVPWKNRGKLGRMTGAFFADVPFFREWDTVEGNFRDLQAIYGIGDDHFGKEYPALAERLGFRSLEREPVKQLSLGQRRRAELGALFLIRPKLLLLDEPTEGLDQTAKDSLRELLAERQAEGTTLVISSHNMGEIAALCERIALLDRGILRHYGDKELLLKHFAPEETMEIRFSGKLPDLDDLPLKRYSLHQDKLTLTYNANYVTSAELLRHILPQTTVTAVTTQKSTLSDVIGSLTPGGIHSHHGL